MPIRMQIEGHTVEVDTPEEALELLRKMSSTKDRKERPSNVVPHQPRAQRKLSPKQRYEEVEARRQNLLVLLQDGPATAGKLAKRISQPKATVQYDLTILNERGAVRRVDAFRGGYELIPKATHVVDSSVDQRS